MFEGEAIGALRADPTRGRRSGEAVFNTALSGYQEIVTDPSYAGQVITFTYPHIGNYGVNDDDDESRRPFCAGVVVRDLEATPSNWRCRALARRPPRAPRRARASPASTPAGSPATCATAGRCRARSAPTRPRCAPRPACARARPTASTSSPPSPRPSPTRSATRAPPVPRRRVRLRHQAHHPAPPGRRRAAGSRSCPPSRPAADVLARGPDGVFLSNGPGDPAAVAGAAANVARAGGGGAGVRHLPRPPDPRPRARRRHHQARRSATTAPTTRCATWPPGGSRSPARTTTTRSIPTRSASAGRDIELTHVNLNDGVVEGFRVLDAPAFGVQHHPEAGPGPARRARYLFDDFTELMAEGQPVGERRSSAEARPTSRRSSSSGRARS